MGQHNDGETWNDFGSWREVSPICSDSLECTDIEFDGDEEGSSESGPEMQQHENDEDGVDGQEENDDDKVDGLSDVNEDRVAEEEVLGDPIGSESEGEQPNRGTSFRVSESGRIVLQVGQLFRNVNEFRQLGSRGLWDLDAANANRSVTTVGRATHMRLEGKERDQEMEELQQRHQLLLAVYQLLLALRVLLVLWFPSNQQGTSSQGNTSNEHFASQPLTPTAPQYSQPSQGAQRK
ncbi:hypothetical protein ACOSQ2_032657 [Xanthoceras sorbifolium]